MKKFVKTSVPIEEIELDGQSAVEINISPANLRDWCLCLQLLHDKLVEALVFPQSSPSRQVEITCGKKSNFGLKVSSDRLEVIFCERDLDYARHFFLRYYRDGAAEVDHIDIQTEHGDYITITVEEYAPPVSPEEARRRLGM